MNKTTLFYIVVIMMTVSSCNSNNKYYKYADFEIDYSTKNDTSLNGVIIPLSIIGSEEFVISDSLMMITTTNPLGQLRVINLKSYEEIVGLCPIGRASNEFNELSDVSTQVYKNNNGDLIMPLVDKYTVLKEVNITQSIKDRRTIVTNRMECPDITGGSFVVLNSDCEDIFYKIDPQFESDLKDLTNMKYYITTSNKHKKEIKVFPKMVRYRADIFDVVNVYLSCFRKHPYKNIVIQPFCNMDYILFFDLDEGNYYAIHKKGTNTFNDIAPHVTGPKNVFFGDIASTNDYFMIIYCGGEEVNNPEDINRTCPDILFFDWNGKYLKSIHLNNIVHRIEYDSINNRLIGLNIPEEIFYSYDLNGLLPII